MIEQGLALLLQGTPAVAAIATSGGGFLSTLPKDFVLANAPSWTYTIVSDPTEYELTGPVSLGSTRIQIDCYGASGADAIRLAKAIDSVLIGYRGTLADPDNTRVQGCFRTNRIDFPDYDARNYRRMLEYMFCADSS
jgi:hypothetical protein